MTQVISKTNRLRVFKFFYLIKWAWGRARKFDCLNKKKKGIILLYFSTMADSKFTDVYQLVYRESSCARTTDEIKKRKFKLIRNVGYYKTLEECFVFLHQILSENTGLTPEEVNEILNTDNYQSFDKPCIYYSKTDDYVYLYLDDQEIGRNYSYEITKINQETFDTIYARTHS
jgi:hypothetical protein